MTADLTSLQDIKHVIAQTLRRFGGLDMLVSNAGIFPGGKQIEVLSDTE